MVLKLKLEGPWRSDLSKHNSNGLAERKPHFKFPEMLQHVFPAIPVMGWFVVILKPRLLRVLCGLSISPRAVLWKTEPCNL